jgi:hypothetical protein
VVTVQVAEPSIDGSTRVPKVVRYLHETTGGAIAMEVLLGKDAYAKRFQAYHIAHSSDGTDGEERTGRARQARKGGEAPR